MNEQLKLDSTTEQVFEVPVGKNYAVFNLLFTNVSAGSSTFNGWIIKAGDVSSNDNLFMKDKTMASNDIFSYNEKIFLSAGDKLTFALDSGTNQINVFINHIEI
jgi:hypothetical protein